MFNKMFFILQPKSAIKKDMELKINIKGGKEWDNGVIESELTNIENAENETKHCVWPSMASMACIARNGWINRLSICLFACYDVINKKVVHKSQYICTAIV